VNAKNYISFFLLTLALLFLAAGCRQPGVALEQKTPVAKVGETYLYREDIPSNFVSGVTGEDSAQFMDNYIRQWVTEQLLVQKARMYLPPGDMKEIEEQVSRMRNDLMVYRYQQELILQKLDTIVVDTLVEKFYNEHTELFALEDNIVKVIFIKIPLSAPNLSQVRRWYRSNRERDLKKLENYCYQYAMKFDDFEDHWVSFDFILDQMPLTVTNQERYLRYNPFIEAKDSVAQYFVRVNEYRLRGTTAPLEYVSDKIVRTLLNERKMKFLRELENNIYLEALNGKKFEIYK
jgi:hypothetical protein